jgi:hypothetical protein
MEYPRYQELQVKALRRREAINLKDVDSIMNNDGRKFQIVEWKKW